MERGLKKKNLAKAQKILIVLAKTLTLVLQYITNSVYLSIHNIYQTVIKSFIEIKI